MSDVSCENPCLSGKEACENNQEDVVNELSAAIYKDAIGEVIESAQDHTQTVNYDADRTV